MKKQLWYGKEARILNRTSLKLTHKICGDCIIASTNANALITKAQSRPAWSVVCNAFHPGYFITVMLFIADFYFYPQKGPSLENIAIITDFPESV